MSYHDLIIFWIAMIAFIFGLPVVVTVGGWLVDFFKRDQANRDGGSQYG